MFRKIIEFEESLHGNEYRFINAVLSLQLVINITNVCL